MKVPASSLAPILRSDTQGRILARLFADPDAGYSLTELVAWVGSSMPTVQREIERAEAAGIVASTRVGPTRVVRANPANPLYRPLREIILATYGPPAVIADEFAAIEGIDIVLLIGSWAARYAGEPGRAPNDIDVLVIGAPSRDAVDDAAERAEQRIGLPVQATVRTRAQWDSERESFIREVKSRPLLRIIGDAADVAASEASA
jgi:hypothetical protein